MKKYQLLTNMDSKILNKDFLFLILLLVIITGVFFWQNPGIRQDYLDKTKAMIGPKVLLYKDQDPGLDLSDINIDKLIAQEEKEEIAEVEKVEKPMLSRLPVDDEEGGVGGPIIGQIPGTEKPLTLEEIEQEVNRIAQEVERIDKEVQILVALGKAQ